jgi:RNA-directed DNA polymerase
MEEATDAMAFPDETSLEDWTQLPWRKLEQRVYRLQRRIYRAAQCGNVRTVHSLQRLLLKSWSARCLAVRRVTQDNRGKRTAGIDGIKSVSAARRPLFVTLLRAPERIQARPVRRVYIPKPSNPDERRPLGIPVMLDRAHQALVKLALEPEWEARFEPNSYGFRPGRSAHDAMAAIYNEIVSKSKYVLDADIRGCFDHIAHAPLLNKLQTFPAMRRTIAAWLKAGILEEDSFLSTESGTPQGGVISPLLANIALHGMEHAVNQLLGTYWQSPHLIRYADDLVVFHARLDGALAAKERLEAWLREIGLELKPSKTHVTHTLHPVDGRVGFDFLGFTVRQHPVGQTHSGKSQHGRRLGFKTLITPSKESVKRHRRSMGLVIRGQRSAPQRALIDLLNPMIRGWANYFRPGVSSVTYATCDSHLVRALLRWTKRRHPHKSWGWVFQRYWRPSASRKWNFATPEDLRLRWHRETKIRRHVKVKGNASPFDGNLRYWTQRLRVHPLTGTLVGSLLLRQQGRCGWCQRYFMEGEGWEVDHVIPRSLGGSDHSSNKLLLHRHCHQQKTAVDGSQSSSGIHDKDHAAEKRNEGKLSRSVLQAGGGEQSPSPSQPTFTQRFFSR